MLDRINPEAVHALRLHHPLHIAQKNARRVLLQIRETQRSLVYSTDRLAESEAVLNRRLRDIYKMGALHTVQVLLEARSFTDLLNRYRYLQQIASYDRQLVERVQSLQADLSAPDFWGRALPNLWVPPLDDPTADPPWGTGRLGSMAVCSQTLACS